MELSIAEFTKGLINSTFACSRNGTIERVMVYCSNAVELYSRILSVLYLIIKDNKASVKQYDEIKSLINEIYKEVERSIQIIYKLPNSTPDVIDYAKDTIYYGKEALVNINIASNLNINDIFEAIYGIDMSIYSLTLVIGEFVDDDYENSLYTVSYSIYYCIRSLDEYYKSDYFVSLVLLGESINDWWNVDIKLMMQFWTNNIPTTFKCNLCNELNTVLNFKNNTCSKLFTQTIEDLYIVDLKVMILGKIGCNPFKAYKIYNNVVPLYTLNLQPIKLSGKFSIPKEKMKIGIEENFAGDLCACCVSNGIYYDSAVPRNIKLDLDYEFRLKAIITAYSDELISVLNYV